jgi:hypothetical protein
MRWFWGFILILIGLVLLGNELGWWSVINLSSLWIYWPLLLVILGVAIATKHWRVGNLLMALVVLASLVFVYFTGIVGEKNLPAQSEAELATTEFSESVPLDIKKAKIIIDSGVIELGVTCSTDKLVEGTYKSNNGEPKITQKTEGDILIYTIKTDKSYDLFGRNNGHNELSLALSDSLPIELEINSNASDLSLDLEQATLDNLKINSGASAITLVVGEKIANNANLSIKSLASNLNVKVPQTVGTDLTINAPLSSSNLDNLNALSRNHYLTDNFSDMDKKITLTINGGASAIDFSTY